jgi:hypothetical protein
VAVAIDDRPVRREAVLPKLSTLESARSKVDQDDATRKTYLFSKYHCADMRLDPLHDLFLILPKSEQTYWDNIRTANLEKGIKDTEFQFKKERILIIYYLLEKIKGLNKGEIRSLADAVLNRRDTHAVRVLGRLKVARNLKEDKSSTSGGYINAAKGLVKSTLGLAKSSNLTTEEALWRDANNFASSVPDTRFLSGLKITPVDECLRDAIVEAEEMAYTYLGKLIESLVDGIGPQIFSNQKAECDKQVQREVTSEEDKELEILRSEFSHQVEDLSRERSRSYVHYSLA